MGIGDRGWEAYSRMVVQVFYTGSKMLELVCSS